MKFCISGSVCKLVFTVSLFAFLYSCSPLHHLAREYVQKQDTISVLLLTPETLIKNDLRFQKRNIPVADSLMLSESRILKDLNDTLVRSLIIENLTDELKTRKFKVFDTKTITEFMLEKSEAYILNCVQIELDEYDTPLQESQQFDTITFSQDFLLNTVSLNIWFEISLLNNTNESTQLVFYSNSKNDKIDGKFRKNILSNEVKYIYTRTDVTVDDIYNLAAKFGVKNASNIFDYFMNQYLYLNFEGKPSKYKYLSYDKNTLKFHPAKSDRFIFMSGN
jgi:hypothetical protein